MLAFIFGVAALLLMPNADTSGWNAETVANRVLAQQPGGCEPVSGPMVGPPLVQGGEESFVAPIRVQVVSPDKAFCRTLIGGKFDPQAAAYEQQIEGTSDLLQVQIDDSAGPRLPARVTAFLITFLGALMTGLAMLYWPTKPGLVARRRRTSRPSRRDKNDIVDHVLLSNSSREKDGSRATSSEDASWTDPRAGVGSEPEAVGAPPTVRPSTRAARRVELAALTTSGVSGLTVDRGSCGPFDVYAATQVGLQHAKDGYTREDAYAIGGAAEQNWVFLAVADGLGSAQNSHAAAQLATQAAITLMQEHVPSISARDIQDRWPLIAQDIATRVSADLDVGRVEVKARQLNFTSAASETVKNSPPACTLVFAALGPVTAEGYPLLWGSVGDSELLIIDLDSGEDSWLTFNETKQSGGMVSNATHALPRDHEQLAADSRIVPANTLTVLASDGMADAIRQEPNQYAQLLPQIARLRPKEWMFGELVGFDLPGLYDDRTIVAAWPRPAAQGASRWAGDEV